ncbi:hypothetical protein Cgig2_003201 [Carnegiea gigantea]|uniref:Uncharacterized protein n=1 Tax=Carnegiea gigantea TaxID=171969 RepID=A0A9Q1K4Z7_9CARY|nr:hypothetical protein Cgig2_003201 [Carnegiea gigantea]
MASSGFLTYVLSYSCCAASFMMAGGLSSLNPSKTLCTLFSISENEARRNSGPFLLPASVSNEDALPNTIHKPEDEEEFKVSEGPEDESEKPPPPASFADLEMKIKESIESLGGAVFPKLNCSSPKDAAWISPTGTLKCTSFSDIALLLWSSDSVVHDLCHAYESCSDKTLSRPLHFYLALRKWYPSLGWRWSSVALSMLDNSWAFPNVKSLPITHLCWRGKLSSESLSVISLLTMLKGGSNLKTTHLMFMSLKIEDMSPRSGWYEFLRNADDNLRQQMRTPEAASLGYPVDLVNRLDSDQDNQISNSNID